MDTDELQEFLEGHIAMVERRMRARQLSGDDYGHSIPLSDRCYQMGLAVALGKLTGETKEGVITRIQKSITPTKKRTVKRGAVKKRVIVRRKK